MLDEFRVFSVVLEKTSEYTRTAQSGKLAEFNMGYGV